eukprot:11200574-Lingulodinium_polyedra.AAC.1
MPAGAAVELPSASPDAEAWHIGNLNPRDGQSEALSSDGIQRTWSRAPWQRQIALMARSTRPIPGTDDRPLVMAQATVMESTSTSTWRPAAARQRSRCRTPISTA